MLTVRVAMRIRPDGCDALVSHLQQESHEIRERFDGCERFDIYCDPGDPTRALLYEEWQSRAAFDAYRQSEYFQAGGAILFPLMDGVPDSAYYESELVGP